MSKIGVKITPTGVEDRLALTITSDPITIAGMLADIMQYFDDPAAIMAELDFPFRERA